MKGVVPGTSDEKSRYSRRSLERSEAVYGADFQSPGGLAAVEAFGRKLDLRPGQRVLDLGCGVGGAAFHLAKRYRVEVVGLDVSPDCIALARERARDRGVTAVSFQVGDICSAELEDESIDLVWSRDVVVCIPEKAQVFENARRWLRNGGRLFMTDFCRSRDVLTDSFRDYVRACGYHLLDLDAYRAALEAAGFRQIEIEDISASLSGWLRSERDRLEADRDAFVARFGEEDLDVMLDRWSSKARFCQQRQLVWGRISAAR